MRKGIFLILCGALFSYAGIILAQNIETGSNGRLNVILDAGARYTAINDSRIRAGEYEAHGDAFNGLLPELGIDINGDYSGIFFEGKGGFNEKDDQDYEVRFDIARYMSQEFRYTRFKHWLDQDPLTNLYGAASAGIDNPVVPQIVTYTDTDPGTEYGIVHSSLESRTKFRVPEVPFGLNPYFNFRMDQRKGYRQARAISKCNACHIVAHRRRVDEVTREYNPGIDAQYNNEFIRLNAGYQFKRRDFIDRADAPVNNYDEVVHPNSEIDNFDDRVQYQNEALKFDEQPDSRNDSHIAKINLYIPSLFTGLFTSGTLSKARNLDQGIEFDYKSFFTRITSSFFPGTRFSIQYRWIDFQNKDIFVDTNDSVSTAGPNAGYTWYNPTPDTSADGADYARQSTDYTRKSSMSRTQNELGADLRYYVTGWLSLKGGYSYSLTERKNYYRAVDADDPVMYYLIPEKTVENSARLSAVTSFRLFNRRPARAQVDYAITFVDTPFSNITAAFVDDERADVGGPFFGTQYWELHAMRNTDLTNQPSLVHEGKFTSKFSIIDALSASISYRLVARTNDDSQQWENTTHVPSAGLWWGINDNIGLNLTYIFTYDKTGSFLNIPVYDG